jgi:hypothetical protein
MQQYPVNRASVFLCCTFTCCRNDLNAVDPVPVMKEPGEENNVKNMLEPDCRFQYNNIQVVFIVQQGNGIKMKQRGLKDKSRKHQVKTHPAVLQKQEENKHRALQTLAQSDSSQEVVKPAEIGALQQMVGNRAVQRHLGELQAKENEEEESNKGAGSLTEDAALYAEEEAMMEVTPWQMRDRQDFDLD